MLIRKGQSEVERQTSDAFGSSETQRLSDLGGLTQFGALVQMLMPGARSSNRHWHEKEDEFLYVLSGEATITENDGTHSLHAGDTACWPAGIANAHYVSNQSNEPCSYVIVGTRLTHDICHYPDTVRTLYSEGGTWRLMESDGTLFRSGRF